MVLLVVVGVAAVGVLSVYGYRWWQRTMSDDDDDLEVRWLRRCLLEIPQKIWCIMILYRRILCLTSRRLAFRVSSLPCCKLRRAELCRAEGATPDRILGLVSSIVTGALVLSHRLLVSRTAVQ